MIDLGSLSLQSNKGNKDKKDTKGKTSVGKGTGSQREVSKKMQNHHRTVEKASDMDNDDNDDNDANNRRRQQT